MPIGQARSEFWWDRTHPMETVPEVWTQDFTSTEFREDLGQIPLRGVDLDVELGGLQERDPVLKRGELRIGRVGSLLCLGGCGS